jgi:glycolate oxidase iron-sulfur subunit
MPVVDGEMYAKFNRCVHCGFCLSTCPTYAETMDEADSPRGRILLMKAAVDGRVGLTERVFEHLDRCLVCRACETACPSGVEYHALVEAVRPQVARAVLGVGRGVRSRMVQWTLGSVLPHPKRMAASLVPLKVARVLGLSGVVDRVMPGAPDLAEAAAEGARAAQRMEAGITAAKGTHRGTVLLLRGCVGSVVSGAVNAACVRVLTRNGFDVCVLEEEPCCGALAAHANDPVGEKKLARELVEAVGGRKVDCVISPIAGCSAQLKALHKVLADLGTLTERAKEISGRTRDICEFLMEVGIEVPTGDGRERVVAYHDPCHLAHAQGITEAPRKLLKMLPGVRLVKLEDADMCCGAAGPYSLNQPGMAERIGTRKAGQIVATGAEEVATGNIGCILQIVRHLRGAGRAMPVRHVVELLAEAYADVGT